MKAAVVSDYLQPPRYTTFRDPKVMDSEILLSVKAAPLTNLVRAQASGQHYSSITVLPLVPGNDGVGVTDKGERVYFVGPRAPFGSMAEKVSIAKAHTIPVPKNLDDVTAAALGNPGLATWGSMLGRAKLQKGEVVLVHGATGAAGQQAIQVAKYLGAKKVIATGRKEPAFDKLPSLGADEVISLSQPDESLLRAFRSALRDSHVNVVLDYLWGHPAELLLQAAAGKGSPQGEPRIRYIQIGQIVSGTITLSGGWLRSSGVELMGSGLGSLSSEEIIAALSKMYEAAKTQNFEIETESVPLKDVESAWNRDTGTKRVVFMP